MHKTMLKRLKTLQLALLKIVVWTAYSTLSLFEKEFLEKIFGTKVRQFDQKNQQHYKV